MSCDGHTINAGRSVSRLFENYLIFSVHISDRELKENKSKFSRRQTSKWISRIFNILNFFDWIKVSAQSAECASNACTGGEQTADEFNFKKCMPINTHQHQIRRRRSWENGAAISMHYAFALSTFHVTCHRTFSFEWWSFRACVCFLHPLLLRIEYKLAYAQAFPWDADMYGQLQSDTTFWM